VITALAQSACELYAVAARIVLETVEEERATVGSYKDPIVMEARLIVWGSCGSPQGE
jgi:hypothetical protein